MGPICQATPLKYSASSPVLFPAASDELNNGAWSARARPPERGPPRRRYRWRSSPGARPLVGRESRSLGRSHRGKRPPWRVGSVGACGLQGTNAGARSRNHHGTAAGACSLHCAAAWLAASMACGLGRGMRPPGRGRQGSQSQPPWHGCLARGLHGASVRCSSTGAFGMHT